MFHLKTLKNLEKVSKILKCSKSTQSEQQLVLTDDNYANNFMRRILMNNDKQRNALSLSMINELHKAIDSIDLKKVFNLNIFKFI